MPSINPGCTACTLYLNAHTVCIAGTGPKNAEIVFVGEAPGRDENAAGVPFIGKAGQELDRLLDEFGFRRDEVFITNAVRCWPPDNRDPTVKELKACRNYLINEINEIKPKYVVALGNFALRQLTGGSGINKHRGDFFPLHGDYKNDGSQVAATFHPSAALRYPQFREQIREDFQALRRTVDGSFADIDLSWRWYAGDRIDDSGDPNWWASDIESTLQENRNPFAHIHLIAIDYGGKDVLVYGGNEGVLERASVTLDLTASFGVRVAGHNWSRFDRMKIRQLFGRHIKGDDTMIMAWLLHEDWGTAKRLNLESVCAYVLGVPPWKRVVNWDWNQPAIIPWDEAAEYCAHDTRYTRLVAIELSKQMKNDGAGTPWHGALWNVYDRLLLPVSRAMADMEEAGGMYVHMDHVNEAIAYYEKEEQEQLTILEPIAAFEGMPDFNPASPPQVGNLLFDRLGFPPVQWTPTGKPSTDVGVLKTLRESVANGTIIGMDHNAIVLDSMLKIRKAQKMKTYPVRFREQRDWQNFLHWWYSITNTVTGRSAGDGQQVPREPRVRRCVGAPPGYVLVQADFSQLEMRVAASKYVFDEPNLRAAFERGDDVHMLLAMEITRKLKEQITKEERNRAKPPNFLFLYGGEEDMYIRTLLEDYDIVKSRADATVERDAFFRRWSKLPDGHGRVIEELIANGQVRSPLGTIRRLPNVYSGTRSVKLAAFREAINFVDQCFSFHIAGIGLVLLRGAGFDVRSFQHDAYLAMVKDNEEAVASTAVRMRSLLEQGVPQVLHDEFGIDFDVPLKVDITAGTAWTDDDRQHWVPKAA